MAPLHPAFVHFPIALVAFSFITDLLGRLTRPCEAPSSGRITVDDARGTRHTRSSLSAQIVPSGGHADFDWEFDPRTP